MSDDGSIPEAESDYPDSGPFCRHWGDPSDCKEPCTCGHRCASHSTIGDDCRECECQKFTDKEEP